MIKKKLVSGITISGNLTIAHYLVIIRQLKALRSQYDLLTFIADFHAITTNHNPQKLDQLRQKAAALYFACGLKESEIFVQSEIHGHTDLAFLLSCHVSFGELNRMTQFKDKNRKKIESSFALLYYPLLMAADIMLYDADVLVGPDQKQHIELARDIANRINHKFHFSLFRKPELVKLPANIHRIRDLQNPLTKMSKSKEKQAGILFLLDSPEIILKKIKASQTDSRNQINLDWENQPGVSNLILLYALAKKQNLEKACKFLQSQCQNYLDLKNLVAQAIIDVLTPIQKEYHELMKNSHIIEQKLRKGNQHAQHLANTKLFSLQKRLGFDFQRFQK